MLAVRVPRDRAEDVRILLTETALLNKHHRILEESGYVEIPILGEPEDPVLASLHQMGAEVIDERDYVWRETFKQPFKDILKAIDIPEDKKEILPTRWEFLGRILVLKVDPRLDDWLDEIAKVYADILEVTTVLRDMGGVTGEYREPELEVLLGTETETLHLENGIKFKFDASRIMFSSGNVDERIRMASICNDGEVVVDMFAGIGYFTLPIAVHSSPDSIMAYEINPLAHRYLEENARLNGVEEVVEANLKNCLDAEEGVADRVIMGYVGTTHEYLPKAARILKGRGVIHYHETCPLRLLPSRPLARVMEAVEHEGLRCRNLDIRTVKSYSPGVHHVVVDADIRR